MPSSTSGWIFFLLVQKSWIGGGGAQSSGAKEGKEYSFMTCRIIVFYILYEPPENHTFGTYMVEHRFVWMDNKITSLLIIPQLVNALQFVL